MTLSEDLAIYAKTICEDTEHGASHILKIASGSLQTGLRKNPDASPLEIRGASKEYVLRLLSKQRQMASILNFSNRLLKVLAETKDDESVGKNMRDFATNISKDSSEALISIGTYSNKMILGSRFMTHSRSSTLLHFLSQNKEKEETTVYVTHSRPGGEGRLLAGELAVAGIRSILIEDAEAMKYLPDVSALIVGADAIIPKGIVNKVGTYMMSLAAKEVGIPVYCLTESIKIWPFDQPILDGLRVGESHFASGNGLFEITPPHLFKSIILETGPVSFNQIPLSGDKNQLAPEIRKLVDL